MTRPETVFDRALAEFKRTMRWSAGATEDEKTLVLANLNGFTNILNKALLETLDAEILASVPPEELTAAKKVKETALQLSGERDRALEEAAKHLEQLDWLAPKAYSPPNICNWVTAKCAERIRAMKGGGQS